MEIKETDEYFTLELTSSLGNKYVVGYPKKAGYTKQNLAVELATANQNRSEPNAAFLDICWKVGETGSTSEEVKKIGIASGSVTKSPGAKLYPYRVDFTNTRGWVFTFKDQSGDLYDCYTVQNGNHYIDYSSTDSTMIGVK